MWVKKDRTPWVLSFLCQLKSAVYSAGTTADDSTGAASDTGADVSVVAVPSVVDALAAVLSEVVAELSVDEVDSEEVTTSSELVGAGAESPLVSVTEIDVPSELVSETVT